MEYRGYIRNDMPLKYDNRIIPEVRDRRRRGYPGNRYDMPPELFDHRVHQNRVIRDLSPHRHQRVPGGRVVYETRLTKEAYDREVAGFMDMDVEMMMEPRPMVINERDYRRERGGYRDRNYLPREEVLPMITDSGYHKGRRYGDRIEEVLPESYRNGGRYDRRYEERIEEVIPDYRHGGYRRERRDVEIMPEYQDRGQRSRRRNKLERVEEIIPDDYREYDQSYYMPDRPRSAPIYY